MESTSPTAVRADIDGVLAQIRQMRLAQQSELNRSMQAPDVMPGSQVKAPDEDSFSAMLGSALSQVNGLQKASSEAARNFVTGKSDDLVGTMLASQKSSIAFQAVTQVRNRVVSAYQDIMNMPI